MQTITHAAGAGSATPFHISATHFHLLETNTAVDVRFYRNGAMFAEATGMEGGFYAEPRGGFDKLEIVSAAAQSVKFAISDGTGGYNRTVGSMQIVGAQGAYTHAQASVTNADQVIVAALATRKHVEIQNNSTTATLRLVFDGTAASATKGVKIAPGGSWQSPAGFAPTTAIHGCMAVADATANNVEIVTA